MRIDLTLCEINITAKVNFAPTVEYCKEYLSSFDKADIELEISLDDISAERAKYLSDCERSGEEPQKIPKAYFESLALYRKICDRMVDYGVILFHGSALSLDGEGFIFTAKSGVGKSTHAGLYRELYGERVEMINDDKPLIRITDNGVFIYGTPWNGKHRLSSNICRPLSAICILKRAKENRIERVSLLNALPDIVAQTHIPNDSARARAVLSLLDKLIHTVRLYRLECNTDIEAARLSYEAMREKKNEN
jgi:hypothetical protein